MTLANSARTSTATTTEDAGFLERPEGALFVVVHRPTDRTPVGLLTVCSSLFAEQHTDYRREVRFARMLASAGVAVARFHYRGVGNSAPASTPVSVEAFARDASDVTREVQRLTSSDRTAFLGVGVGALVAAQALGDYPGAPLLLWKPAAEGARFLRDFLRARVIAATRSGAARPDTNAELLAKLTSHGHVDVMGFSVTASLHVSLTGARLAEALPTSPRRIFIQPMRGNRASAVDRLAEDWRAAGSLVDIEPVKLPEDPWFIPDGAEAAAAVLALEDQLMESARDWLLGSWRNDG